MATGIMAATGGIVKLMFPEPRNPRDGKPPLRNGGNFVFCF
jgi:hypothetical protein